MALAAMVDSESSRTIVVPAHLTVSIRVFIKPGDNKAPAINRHTHETREFRKSPTNNKHPGKLSLTHLKYSQI